MAGEVRAGLLDILGEQLAALVLTGSVASGEHDEASDLDLVAVLGTPAIDDDSIVGLCVYYDRLVDRNPAWADRIEVVHVDQVALTHFRTGRHQMAFINPGEPLRVVPCTLEWLADWHLAREHGELLHGNQRDVTWPPTTQEEYLAALASYVMDVARRAPDAGPRYLAYSVLTTARGVATHAVGTQVSKAAAVEWAARELDPASAALVRASFDARARDSRIAAGIDRDAALALVSRLAAQLRGLRG